MISTSPAQAASPPHSRRADHAAVARRPRRAPRAARRRPRSASRRAPPRPARCSRPARPAAATSISASSPSAIGRSKWLPSFDDIGRREVDRDAPRRQREAERRRARRAPARATRRPPCPAGRRREGRQPGGDRHLGFDIDDLDPVKRHGANPRHHVPARSLRARRQGRRDGRGRAATAPALWCDRCVRRMRS